jgi:peroxiredoxin
MRLRENVSAPAFKLTDIYGNLVDLNEYCDKKLLIGFFRHAGCPFCNLRVHALTRIYETVKGKGLEMIFFFESKERILRRSTFHREVSPIPIISDPDKVWYEAYGLEPSAYKSAVSHIASFVQAAMKARTLHLPVHMMKDGESITTMPAEFLVGEGLLLKRLHYSESLNDRMDIKEIISFAETGK